MAEQPRILTAELYDGHNQSSLAAVLGRGWRASWVEDARLRRTCVAHQALA